MSTENKPVLPCCFPADFDVIPGLSCYSFQNRSIPQVSSRLRWRDYLGSCKVRVGIGRMHYKIPPGLYALGQPDQNSPVLVSANYKLSFDRLRSELPGRDAWLLVLDTRGINVWCAAGKGTFGTEELLRKIKATGLADIVAHRTLIVPQLGAVGISAHQVKRGSGFGVVFGPVRAQDLPTYLDAGMQATPAMREVRFPLWDRLVLIPVELVIWGKYLLFAAFAAALLAGLHRGGFSRDYIITDGLLTAAILLFTYAVGLAAGMILLPWLPGRAFAIKGLCLGLVASGCVIGYAWPLPGHLHNWLTVFAWLLVIPAVTSFLVMNLTGVSTFTSLSGVKREMRIAVPLQAIGVCLGAGMWLAGRFI